MASGPSNLGRTQLRLLGPVEGRVRPPGNPHRFPGILLLADVDRLFTLPLALAANNHLLLLPGLINVSILSLLIETMMSGNLHLIPEHRPPLLLLFLIPLIFYPLTLGVLTIPASSAG
jgi:hypothetical protein